MTCTSREGAKNKIVEKRNGPEKYEFIDCQKILRFFLGILIQKTIFWQPFFWKHSGKIRFFNEKAALARLRGVKEGTNRFEKMDWTQEKCLDLALLS